MTRSMTTLFVLLVLVAGCRSPEILTEPVVEAFDCSTKLDSRANRAATSGEGTVGVFVRTTREPLDSDIRDLESAGLLVGTVVGSIVTGRVASEKICDVARLDVVQGIEMARRIHLNDPSIPVG